MPRNRRLTVVIALFAIALAISLFYNTVQSIAKARLSYQNRSLERDIESLRETVRQELYPSPASVTDIQMGKYVLAIPQQLHNRRVQIVPYDKKLADSGWLVINLPPNISFQVAALDITLFYRDQNGEKNHEWAVYPIQSAKDWFNEEKQRLEILVPRHLSSISRLRFIHKNGIPWDFSIEHSKLIWKEN